MIAYRQINSDASEEREFFTNAFAASTHTDPDKMSAENLEKIKTALQKIKAGEKGHVCIMAKDSNRLFGLIWLKPAQGAREPVEVAYIENLYVDPAYRARGIALQLKKRGEDLAREQGFTFLESRVRTDNEKMLNLNRKLGYHMEGPEEKWGRMWYWCQLKL
jgi:GNAT superfamily N-acetyltransferase